MDAAEEALVFVAQLDSKTGKMKKAELYGSENDNFTPAGMAVSEGILTLGGTKWIKKFEEPNRNYEADLVFFRAHIDTGNLIELKYFDLKRDRGEPNIHP